MTTSAHESVITVVGLGRLGACVAAVFSAAGFVVHGADQNPDVLGAILANKPNPEPGLNALIAEHPFHVDSDTVALARESDIALIVVPTPSGPDGRFDCSLVCAAVADVARGFAERARATYPVVVIVSTTMPGQVDGEITEAIELEGLTVGVDCGLVYAPSLIALGDVIRNLREPDVCMVGCGDDAAAKSWTHVLRKVVKAATPFRRMSIIDTEIAKLSINAYLSLKIGFANTVARICEQHDGADATEVLATVGADHRIGSAFLKHGATAGGPCLSRDVAAIETVGANAVASMVRMADAETLDWVATNVDAAIAKADDHFVYDVAVLGVAYKPASSITLDSFGVRVLNRVRALYATACHDPYANVNIQRVTQELRFMCAQDAAVLVVACPHELYGGLVAQPGQTILDVWSVCADGDGVIRPGVGPAIK